MFTSAESGAGTINIPGLFPSSSETSSKRVDQTQTLCALFSHRLFQLACRPARDFMSYGNRRARFTQAEHYSHQDISTFRYLGTAAGLCRSNYTDRLSAMPFMLDTHYPRIASSKLELAVCGSLCA